MRLDRPLADAKRLGNFLLRSAGGEEAQNSPLSRRQGSFRPSRSSCTLAVGVSSEESGGQLPLDLHVTPMNPRIAFRSAETVASFEL